MLKKLCLKKKTNTYSTEKRKQTKNVIKKKTNFRNWWNETKEKTQITDINQNTANKQNPAKQTDKKMHIGITHYSLFKTKFYWQTADESQFEVLLLLLSTVIENINFVLSKSKTKWKHVSKTTFVTIHNINLS